MTHNFDVIVVGGGAAGLSGGLTLARARRSVLVLDAGEQRNLPATGVHGFLTRDGLSPAELVALGTVEVESYGGTVRTARAAAAALVPGGVAVTTDDGERYTARRLLLTTGLVDELPEVPGLRELWGSDVVHCPYCHGWEIRDRAIGVLGSGPLAVHQALLFSQWSRDVVLFLHTSPDPTPDECEQLAALGVEIVDGEVAGLEIVDGRLTGVRMAAGRLVPRTALAVGPRFAARTDLLSDLGLAVTEHPRGVGTFVEADPAGRTTVPGVWVAGNVADPMAQVVASAAAGVMAGAAINFNLVEEDARAAVAARRPFSAAAEAEAGERVLGERRHGLAEV